MKITKGIRVKSQINKEKKVLLRQFLGMKRFIWNIALDYKIQLWETYKRRNPCVDNLEEKKLVNKLKSNSEIQKMFAKKEIMNYEGFEFLSLLPNRVVQQTLNDLEVAFSKFYDPELPNEYPKFKKKYETKQSIRFLDALSVIKLNKKNIRVKIGNYFVLQGINPERGNKTIFNSSTKINNVTLTMDNLENVYFSINYSYEENSNENLTYSKDEVGIDMGISNTVALSGDKGFRDLPKKIKELEVKKKRLQRRNSKNKKRTIGSRAWAKTKRQIAKIYKQQTHIREDFYHKLSDELTKSHGLIVREDLKIKNMTKSAKGTLDKPGKNVAQKRGLNREILNQAWGTFFKFLEYKGLTRGVIVLKVPTQGSSQTCKKCHYRDPKSRRKKMFKCVSCGYTADADTNGANIILTRGQRELAGREDLIAIPTPLESDSHTSTTPELEKSPLKLIFKGKPCL